MKNEGGGEATVRLSHPAVVVGLVVWLLNDHVFKAAYGTWWTGKLSDVAGLVIFPLLLATILDRWVPRAIEWSMGVTAALFISINLLAPADRAVEAGLSLVLDSTLTPDPTDLVTLPALGLSWWVWQQPPMDAGRLRRAVGRLVFAAGIVASVATSNDGAVSQRYEGTVTLTETQPEVVIPLSLSKDGSPLSPNGPMEVNVSVTAFGEDPENRSRTQLQDAVGIEISDGPTAGKGAVTLRVKDPSLAPVQVEYGLVAFVEDDSGDTDLELQAELPPDEAFEPIVFVDNSEQDIDETVYAEWRITTSAESTLMLGMPSRVDPGDVRLVTETGRIDHAGGRAIPLERPEGCAAVCEFSLWLAQTPFSPSLVDVALYDITGDATVDVVDLEHQVLTVDLTTEEVRVDSSGALHWAVEVEVPEPAASPRERALTFLTSSAIADNGGDDLGGVYAEITGLDVERSGLTDDCCDDIRLTLEIYEGDTEDWTADVSATVQLLYHSPAPIPAEEFSAALRRN